MDRTIVAITGASSGIGAEFARQLAPKHDLILIARRVDRLKSAAEEYATRYRTQVETLQADLCVDRELEQAAVRIAGERRLEMMINSAGFGVTGRFWESPPEVQERMNRLHITATARLAHAALGNLVPRNIGALINVASVSGWVRRPGFIGYAATKSWMLGFTEGLHLELREAKSDVIVQALCPGLVYTEFHDTMGMDRKRLGGAGLWQTAESVVEASLAGLRKRKLYVIPGWRYRALVGLLPKLPTPARLAAQRLIMRGRGDR